MIRQVIHRQSLLVRSAFPYYSNRLMEQAAPDQQSNMMECRQNLFAIKDGKMLPGSTTPALSWFAAKLKAQAERLTGFLGPDTQVVPIPSSGVTSLPPDPDTWPMLALAILFARVGLAWAAVPAVTRRTAVARSHAVSGAARPTVAMHRDSLAVNPGILDNALPITLLDDVITRGSSAMGCALALRREGFMGEIRIFTVAYTASTGREGRLPRKVTMYWSNGELVPTLL